MFKLFKTAAIAWFKRDPFTHSAAISYYTIFSFPALMIVIISIAGIIFDKSLVSSEIISYMQGMIGKKAAQNLFEIVQNSSIKNDNIVLFVVGLVALLFTSIRLFIQLQTALNNIWGSDTKHKTWIIYLKRRAESFGVMVSIGFALMVSLISSTLLTTVAEWTSAQIDDSVEIVFHLVNFIITYITITLLFSLIIKILPDAKVLWKAAWRGGAISGGLFMIGQYALSAYFGISKPDSAYGVTGSVILLMLWVSYSCLILLYGAEFAKVYMDDKKKLPSRRRKTKRT